MNIIIYDLGFLVLFTAFVVWFLYTHRNNLKREGILYLYRTKFGMRAIEATSKKFKGTLRWLQYVSITTGYILMASIIFLFFQLVYIYIRYPATVRAIKIPPIMPLIPYLPSIFNLSFLPPFYFTYWIVILAVVAISHEFAHGILARFHNIKVKSTGFGFLGPFLAAFVEPDEKQMEKRSIKQQLSVLSAGTFANVLMTILFIIIFIAFFYLAYIPAGAQFSSYAVSNININQIDNIAGKNISNPTPQIILADLQNNSMNLTQISVNGQKYLIDNNVFRQNINLINETVVVYNDLPAARAGVQGAVIGINNYKIKSWTDFKDVINKYSPGDNVTLKTKTSGNQIHYYNITLTENSRGEPAIGVILLLPDTSGIRGKIYLLVSYIRQPGVYYESVINNDLALFIYNFLWWMILINISVALMNMLPLGIFDGGRVFYLTILHFTKSKSKAEKTFKYVTWFLLFLVVLLIFFWAFSFVV